MKLFISTLILCAAPLYSALAASPCQFTVGVVPQFEQRKIIKTWQPILKTLEEKTGCSYNLKGTQTIAEFEAAFNKGEYDIAYMNPYHAIMAHDSQGYVPIARSGAKQLKGILTVHKDSGITKIEQLQGATIAFPSPNALGASLLMRAELKRKHGIDITPLYVETHSSVYLHTAKKLTKAGGGVMRTLDEQRPSLQNKLNIIYTTTPVSAHPLVVHPRIEADMQKTLQKAWFEMATENIAVFDGVPMKQPVTATIDDYVFLRTLDLHDFVGGTH